MRRLGRPLVRGFWRRYFFTIHFVYHYAFCLSLYIFLLVQVLFTIPFFIIIHFVYHYAIFLCLAQGFYSTVLRFVETASIALDALNVSLTASRKLNNGMERLTAAQIRAFIQSDNFAFLTQLDDQYMYQVTYYTFCLLLYIFVYYYTFCFSRDDVPAGGFGVGHESKRHVEHIGHQQLDSRPLAGYFVSADRLYVLVILQPSHVDHECGKQAHVGLVAHGARRGTCQYTFSLSLYILYVHVFFLLKSNCPQRRIACCDKLFSFV